MKLSISIICMACMVGMAMGESYEPLLDRVEVEPILADDKIFKEYIFCFLDKTRCNYVPGRAKRILKDVISTSCTKCTQHQKHGAKLFYAAFQERYPEEYEEFTRKYDPKGKYMDSLLKTVANA